MSNKNGVRGKASNVTVPERKAGATLKSTAARVADAVRSTARTQSVSQLPYVHLDQTLEITSSLTGRRVLVNPTLMQFAVLPTFTPERAAAAAQEWEQYLSEQAAPGFGRGARWYRAQSVRRVLDPCLAADDRTKFAKAVNALATTLLATHGRSGKDVLPGTNLRMGEVVTLLCIHGCLALPLINAVDARFLDSSALPPVEERWFGDAASVIGSIDATRELAGTKWRKYQWRYLMNGIRSLLLSMHGPTAVGDLSYEVFDAMPALFGGEVLIDGKSASKELQKRPTAILTAVHKAHLLAYSRDPQMLQKLPASYLYKRKTPRRQRAEAPFEWISAEYPEREEWRSAAEGYLRSITNRTDITGIRSNVRTMLSSLVRCPEVPPTPRELCLRVNADAAAALIIRVIDERPRSSGHRISLLTAIEGLLDYALDTEECHLDDGSLDPRYTNPAKRLKIPRGRPAQTIRRAMPLWLMREVRRVLEADDFAFPRTLQVDYFDGLNYDTGELERHVWCPVVAELTLLRLLLPLRVVQGLPCQC